MSKKPSTKPPAQATPSSGAGFVEIGKEAPNVNLPDQAGTLHSLMEWRGKWVVLYFYPKDDTSGCTAEACAFRDESKTFGKLNAVIVGVSPDDAKSHAKFATKYNLPFTLLADTDKSACNAYGVWKEKSMYGRKYMGVERTTYLINPAGKVAHRWEKVKVGDHIPEALAKLKELAGA